MTSPSAPRVSVVIPTYNMELHIERTIQSATKQTFKSIEIIVVDDCSTDSTAEIVLSLASADPRIRYTRLDRNSNLPAVPRNVGILSSKGEYIALLDHDDTWTPRKIERQVALLDRDSRIDMVHAPLWVHVQGNPLRGMLRLPNPLRLRTTLNTLLKRNTVMCSSVVFRRSAIERTGAFSEDPKLRTVEDYELWLRMATSGVIAFQPFICGIYFLTVGGALSQENTRVRLDYLRSSSGLAIRAISTSRVNDILAQLAFVPIILAIIATYEVMSALRTRVHRGRAAT